MLRICLLIVTGAACICAGATAALAAFATELDWPLSEINFRDAATLGAPWGIVGAVLAIVVLSLAKHEYLWLTAVFTILLTWLVIYVGFWWYVVSGLG